jgi:hypothetical protein
MNAYFLWGKFFTRLFVRQSRKDDNIQLALTQIRCKLATRITRILLKDLAQFYALVFQALELKSGYNICHSD